MARKEDIGLALVLIIVAAQFAYSVVAWLGGGGE